MFFLPGEVLSSLALILGDLLGESLAGVPSLEGVLNPCFVGVPVGLASSADVGDADDVDGPGVAEGPESVGGAGAVSRFGFGVVGGAELPGLTVGWGLVALRSPDSDLTVGPGLEEEEEENLLSEA